MSEEQLTVEDIIGDAGEAHYHSILEVWDSILAPVVNERRKPPTAQWSTKVLSKYHGLTYQDMPALQELFYDKIEELHIILRVRIEEDPESLNVHSAEEDIEQNALRYKHILFDWQKAFLLWEIAWEATDPSAAIIIGAMSEVHGMFFGQTGIIALLEQVNFEFTEQDQQELAQEFELLKASDE